jgi:hypothetical protein
MSDICWSAFRVSSKGCHLTAEMWTTGIGSAAAEILGKGEG